MEKVAAAGSRDAGSQGKLRFRAPAVLAVCCVCPLAWAQDFGANGGDAMPAQAQLEPPQVRVQVQTSALPRLEAQDSGFQAPRVDVSLFPQQAAGLGAVVGMSGFSARQPQALGLQSQRPSVDLGVRWSHKLQSQQVDITAWRRMTVEEDAYSLIQAKQPLYGARFELALSGARKKGFATDLGFIGLQLEGGARISIKRKNGGPMLYYRTSF